MKITIIGAGAIGSVVAAQLAKAGVEVCLVGKKEQAKAINENGLKLITNDGEETVKLKALSQLDQAYDLVVFTTKTQDLEVAYQHNNEYLDDAVILSSQNGVQADSILGFHFDKENTYSSIVMFGATYTKPGEVTYNFPGDWIIGKLHGANDTRLQEIAEVLGKGFNVVVSSDIMAMKWTKLFVNFNNCIPALTGKSMQETFADLDLCRLSVQLLKEGLNVVKEAKVRIMDMPDFPVERLFGLAAMPEDQAAGIMNKTLTGLSKEPLYGSILQSIMRGKTSEIDFINGEVVALASQIRTKAPLNEKMVAMVHEVENTGQFFELEKIKNAFQLTATA